MCSGRGPGRRPRSCARGAASGRLSWLLSLTCFHLLLPCDCALRTAPAASVGARALAAYRQPAAMAHSAIRADLGHSLDVRRHLTAEVALDEDLLGGRHTIDDLTKPPDLLFGEVPDAYVWVDVGHLHQFLGGRRTDPVYVGERNHRPLLRGYVDAGNACHLAQLLTQP